MPHIPLREPLRGTGLAPLLSTGDFAEWEEATHRTLGHHRSRLVGQAGGFEAHYRLGWAGPLQVLHIRGRGEVELHRTQRSNVVLWLPLLGLSEECINGNLHSAESGMALLFRPGDEMRGRSSQELEGISVLMPDTLLPGGGPSLLQRGPRAREVVDMALELAQATACGRPGMEHGAFGLVEALRAWQQEQNDPEKEWRERPGAARARTLVNEGLAWMKGRLGEPFTVTELAAGLSSSVRALQYAFQQELGRSPLAEARRQRLRLLRERLLDPHQSHVPIGLVMADCGLLAAGSAAREYRELWGELPRETRQQRTPYAGRGSRLKPPTDRAVRGYAAPGTRSD
jgi:AraC-like DNA-binding protein